MCISWNLFNTQLPPLVYKLAKCKQILFVATTWHENPEVHVAFVVFFVQEAKEKLAANGCRVVNMASDVADEYTAVMARSSF